jgi:hypothetical protein
VGRRCRRGMSVHWPWRNDLRTSCAWLWRFGGEFGRRLNLQITCRVELAMVNGVYGRYNRRRRRGEHEGRLRSVNCSWPICELVRGVLFHPRHRQDGDGNCGSRKTGAEPRSKILHQSSGGVGSHMRALCNNRAYSLWDLGKIRPVKSSEKGTPCKIPGPGILKIFRCAEEFSEWVPSRQN